MPTFVVTAIPQRSTDALAVSNEILAQGSHSVIVDTVTLSGAQLTEPAFLAAIRRQESAIETSGAIAYLALPVCSCTQDGAYVREGDVWAGLGEPVELPVFMAREVIETGLTDAGTIKISVLRWKVPSFSTPLDISVRIRNFVEDHEGEKYANRGL
jgi:hypothetical protein